MKIVFDKAKQRRNREKHGFDFADFERCFDRDTALVLPTRASRTGRTRYLFIGLWNGDVVVLAVVSPLGSEALSLVSLRRADEQEREAYDRHFET
jgi:uncharacterized protein